MTTYEATIRATTAKGITKNHYHLIEAASPDEAWQEAKGWARCYVGARQPNGTYQRGTVIDLSPSDS